MSKRDPIQLSLFETLVREHHKRILAFARSLVNEENQAEDLAQEAFIVAFDKLETFDSTRDFGAWIRGIVRLKYLESTRVRKEIPLDAEIIDYLNIAHQTWDTWFLDEDNDVFNRLQNCLEKLENISREFIDRFYYRKQKCEIIAQECGFRAPTVRKRLERIRQELRLCIEGNSGN